VLVTNAHPDCVTIKFSATCIDSLLDQVISSHDYGCPKEFPNFWNALQKRSPFNPTKTLFIDNSIAVLNTTKNYGIANIVYIDKPDSTQSSSPFAEFSSISHLAELLIIDEAFHNG
jgi:FMN phosphatase YigB (HAD superfamily)